jgi:competence protein ComEC
MYIYLWGDVGWYLSFFAFAGVMIVGPLIDKILWGKREPRPLASIVTETVSAEMMTLPIILAVFGYAPAVGLLANVLVCPLIPISMLTTAIAGVAGMILPGLAGWAGAPAQFILSYIVSVVQWLAASCCLKYSYQFKKRWLIYLLLYYNYCLKLVKYDQRTEFG